MPDNHSGILHITPTGGHFKARPSWANALAADDNDTNAYYPAIGILLMGERPFAPASLYFSFF